MIWPHGNIKMYHIWYSYGQHFKLYSLVITDWKLCKIRIFKGPFQHFSHIIGVELKLMYALERIRSESLPRTSTTFKLLVSIFPYSHEIKALWHFFLKQEPQLCSFVCERVRRACGLNKTFYILRLQNFKSWILHTQVSF